MSPIRRPPKSPCPIIAAYAPPPAADIVELSLQICDSLRGGYECYPSDVKQRAHAVVSSRCLASSKILITAFVLSIVVVVCMIIQIMFGSTPRGYPVLSVCFPLALLLSNIDTISILFNAFLPGFTNKVLYFTMLGLQVMFIFLTIVLSIDNGFIPRTMLSFVLVVLIVIMIVLFKRRISFDSDVQSIRCGLVALFREFLDAVGAFDDYSVSDAEKQTEEAYVAKYQTILVMHSIAQYARNTGQGTFASIRKAFLNACAYYNNIDSDAAEVDDVVADDEGQDDDT